MPSPGMAPKPPDVASNFKSKSPAICAISSAFLKKLI